MWCGPGIVQGSPPEDDGEGAERSAVGTSHALPAPKATDGPGRVPGRVRGAASRAERKATSVGQGVVDWGKRQDAATLRGLAVGWYRRYCDADGGFYSLVLTAFLFTTLLPAAVVLDAYARSNPAAAADAAIERLGLSGATADLVRSVLVGAGGHRLGAMLIAVASVVTSGLGIGNALQRVHARAWGIKTSGSWIGDQARYLAWFLAFLGLILLLIVELAYLPADSAQVALTPVWALISVAFFAWTARFLLHHRVSRRDVLPGAILMTLGLLGLYLLSVVVLKNWLDWYSTYYGGLGVVMAIFFWMLIAAYIFVAAATLSPADAERRRLRRARARTP